MASVVRTVENTDSQPTSPQKAIAKPLSKTVKLDQNSLDSLMEQSNSVCPSCHYPYSGSPKVCPNCGTDLKGTTKKDIDNGVGPAPQPQKQFKSTVRDVGSDQKEKPVNKGKATIREIPKSLLVESEEDVYCLVPVEGCFPSITIKLGQTVEINGIRYRFGK